MPHFEKHPHFLLHWDSKLLLSVANGSVKTLDDRAGVLVNDKEFWEVACVPIDLKDTGEHMFEVVIRKMDRLGLHDVNIIATSFNTKTFNTKLIQGACTRIHRWFR